MPKADSEVLTGIDLDGYVESGGYDVSWSSFSKAPWSWEPIQRNSQNATDAVRSPFSSYSSLVILV